MEGELWKWTNYWNGWQSRWFILDGGVLSYYKSLEEVERGCKGSINVSACEIRLHPTDHLRLDLTIPGEQHMYVRANSEKARQQWLVALGSAKACLSNQARPSSPPTNVEVSKAKKAELRLYCDMLMQQVHNIKQAVSNVHDGGGVDLELLNEGSSLLSETCDTFIRTLDELMTDQPGVGQGYSIPVQNGIGGVSTRGGKSSSLERYLDKTASQIRPQCFVNLFRALPSVMTNAGKRNRTESTDSIHNSMSGMTLAERSDGFRSVFGTNNFESQDPSGEASPVKLSMANNLLEIDYKFPLKLDFPVMAKGSSSGIPTKEFLEASAEAIHIFDFLNAKLFSPIKTDLIGSIQSLRTKFTSDPELFSTLQAMVASEIAEGKSRHVTSATANLLSLVRNLSFILVFLKNVVEDGGPDASASTSLESSLARAYELTLMDHHGLVVRSVFSVAIKKAPNRGSFLSALGLPECPEVDCERFFQVKVVPEMVKYLDRLEPCLTELSDFYKDLDTSSKAS